DRPAQPADPAPPIGPGGPGLARPTGPLLAAGPSALGRTHLHAPGDAAARAARGIAGTGLGAPRAAARRGARAAALGPAAADHRPGLFDLPGTGAATLRAAVLLPL